MILYMYPNILSLNKLSIRHLEYACRLKNHLGDESLTKRIEKDRTVLKSYGLTGKDLLNNHVNMIFKLNKSNKYNAFTTFEIKNHEIDKLIDNAPDELVSDWSCVETVCNKIDINEQTLLIQCFIWSKSEECPIEKYFNPRAEFTTRGNKDFFIVNLDNNKSIWIPDLVMYQIGHFDFFQGVKSKYRVDPVKYIEVMGIKSKIDVLPTVSIIRWSTEGVITGKIKNVVSCNKTDKFKTYLYDEGNRMCIRFLDRLWLDSVMGKIMSVFGIQFKVHYEHHVSQWYAYSKKTDTFLEDDDNTDEIDFIKNKEKKVHEERGKIILNEITDLFDPLSYV